MRTRDIMPIFAATLFTSAFLIFAVQPMVSKMLLPMLGGSPSVWNTAMVFFQGMLLAGYAYAHLVAKFVPLRVQGVIHVALLLACMIFLPLGLPDGAAPPDDDGQAGWQLGIMLACVGGPFFVLAASAPLFQHWFSASGHEDAEDPYFLYAVSNLGSMISLLGYPLVIEPFLGLSEQSWAWFGGYLVLVGLTGMCAWSVRDGTKPVAPLATGPDRAAIGWKSRAIWILLAFIPSSLMLGVTTTITTDLASAPFIWIVPLAIYLATFIMAFAKKPFLPVSVTRELTAYFIAFIVLAFMVSGFVTLKLPMIFIHLVTFFLASLLCHGELAKAKPSASHLTEYFLLISVGGVLGGIFNALIAPNIFIVPIEYQLTMALVGFVIWFGGRRKEATFAFNAAEDRNRRKKLLALDIFTIAFACAICAVTLYSDTNLVKNVGMICLFGFLIIMVQNRMVFAVTASIALLTFQPYVWSLSKELLAMDRNYFGVLKVYGQDDVNFFYHGTTIHGAESQKEAWKFTPVAYYNPVGPVQDIFKLFDKRGGEQKIAGLGLGVGSIACYDAPGRHFNFYEIDADVVRIAEDTRYFSFLKGCGSPYDIVLGDARLKISAQPADSYDMIFIDTFSSDNIPVHIMTREAFVTYLDKLKPGGIIAMNISNRYLDLRPVLNAIADDLGLTIAFKYHHPESRKGDISELYTDSMFAVIAEDPKDVAELMEDDGWRPLTRKTNVRAWTDDYANIIASIIALQ